MLQLTNRASEFDTNLFDSFLLTLLCNLLKAQTEALVRAMLQKNKKQNKSNQRIISATALTSVLRAIIHPTVG